MFNKITKLVLVAVLAIVFSGCASTGAGAGSDAGFTDVLIGSKGLLRDASKLKGHAFESKFNDLAGLTDLADKLR